MSNVNQGMHNILKMPITIVSNADITNCKTLWMGQWRHRVPYAIWRKLTEQGHVFTEKLKRTIFPARFENAMPSECEVICMWYDRINRALTYVTFDGDKYPRV